MSAGNTPPAWEKKESHLVADCRIFKVFRNRFFHPVRRSEGDFFTVESADWITVVALTESRELVAIRQYRFGIEDLSLEVPAGVMEAGEDPLQTGIRELREETGFVGEDARLLGWVFPNPAIQTNRCFVVGILDARPSGQIEWDEHEEINTELIPLDQVSASIERGDFRHSLSVCALSYFQIRYPW